jgi:hypothetical protein
MEVHMTHALLVGASSAVIAALLGSCSESERSRSEESGRLTDSAKAMAAKPVERRVSMSMIGKRVGAGNRVTEPTFQFAPQDTVYLSVATEGSGGTNKVTAAWRSQSGEIVQQTSEPVQTDGNASFALAQPKGLKPGTYKVVVFLGDDSVDAKVFAVKK